MKVFLVKNRWLKVACLLGCLSIAGCTPEMNHQAAKADAPPESQLSIESISAFHVRLNRAASEHFLEAHYQGLLAVTGRALEMRDSSAGFYTWSVTRRSYDAQEQEAKEILFEVSILPSGGANGIATTNINGASLSIRAEVGEGVSLDAPQKYLSGMSIRSFLENLEEPASSASCNDW